MNRHPQIRAVIWGHVHQEFADRRGAVELLATPSTCVQFRPGIAKPEVDDRTPGYRWFDLGPDGTLETGVERVPR
jgi:Icc protein